MSKIFFVVSLFAVAFIDNALSCGTYLRIVNQKDTEGYWVAFFIYDLCANCGSITKVEIKDNINYPSWTQTTFGNGYYSLNNNGFTFDKTLSLRITNSNTEVLTFIDIITSLNGGDTFYGDTNFCWIPPSPTMLTSPPTNNPTSPSIEICMNASSPTNLIWTSTNNQIYLNGNKFNMKGLSWFGFETDVYIVHGLASWANGGKPYTFFFDFLVNEGFNAIRLPFSQDLVNNNPTIAANQYDATGNTIFSGKTALEAMDIIIDAAAERGILIMLDYHSKTANQYQQGMNDIIQNDAIAAWETLADRYKDRWNIFMADILNEAHDVGNWNQATTYKWTDYMTYTENVAEALIAKSVNWLFMVQGTNADCNIRSMSYYCNWGGNLQGIDPAQTDQARTFSISVADRLVWSPHVYGPSIADNSYSDAIWQNHWGYLCDGSYPSNGAACVVGEFGGLYQDPAQITWMDSFISYLISIDQRNTYFWCLNANSGDTGGLLADDWTTPKTAKLAALSRLQPFPTNIIYSSSNNEICTQFIIKSNVSTTSVPATTITTNTGGTSTTTSTTDNSITTSTTAATTTSTSSTATTSTTTTSATLTTAYASNTGTSTTTSTTGSSITTSTTTASTTATSSTATASTTTTSTTSTTAYASNDGKTTDIDDKKPIDNASGSIHHETSFISCIVFIIVYCIY